MSTLRVNTVTDSAGSGNPDVGIDTSGIAKAWVNFNGTGTVAIRQAFNVSTITDNGTGNYTVNLTVAMPDTNYNFVTNSSNTNSSNILCIGQLNWDNPTKTTSALRLYNLKTTNGALTDQDTISVTIFR